MSWFKLHQSICTGLFCVLYNFLYVLNLHAIKRWSNQPNGCDSSPLVSPNWKVSRKLTLKVKFVAMHHVWEERLFAFGNNEKSKNYTFMSGKTIGSLHSKSVVFTCSKSWWPRTSKAIILSSTSFTCIIKPLASLVDDWLTCNARQMYDLFTIYLTINSHKAACLVYVSYTLLKVRQQSRLRFPTRQCKASLTPLSRELSVRRSAFRLGLREERRFFSPRTL